METFSLLLILAFSLYLVVRSSDYAIRYSTKVARSLLLPKYIIGFLIVAVISILPEMFISITSAAKGVPSFGLATLFGSNVADMSLILGLIILLSMRGIKVEERILRNQYWYIGVIAVPIILGLNGFYSRIDGIVLVLVGIIFYAIVLKKGGPKEEVRLEKFSLRDLLMLVLSMAILLLGANLVVKYGVSFAESLKLDPVIIGMFVVALGTTLPEFFFSLRAVKHHHDSLALGDILGTVIADATIIVGLISIVNPFPFSGRIVYITGVFMLLAMLLLVHLMKTGRTLTKKEAFLLLLFYVVFSATELIVDFS